MGMPIYMTFYNCLLVIKHMIAKNMAAFWVVVPCHGPDDGGSKKILKH